MNAGLTKEAALELAGNLAVREAEYRKLITINEKRERELALLQQKIAEREALFAERESKLVERQHEFEMRLRLRERDSEELRKHLTDEIATREAQLQAAQGELLKEKQRYNEESRKRIEQNSQDYVAEALRGLEKKERQFHWLSKGWAALGAISLVFGLVFFAYVTVAAPNAMPAPVSWEFIFFSVSKGLIAIALLAGLARYAFVFSNSYMREALKNADRTHAINFGKFYLQSYGAAADWSQVKEAFADWNISGSNAFTPNSEQSLDLSAMERAASLLGSLARSLPKPVPELTKR